MTELVININPGLYGKLRELLDSHDHRVHVTFTSECEPTPSAPIRAVFVLEGEARRLAS